MSQFRLLGPVAVLLLHTSAGVSFQEEPCATCDATVVPSIGQNPNFQGCQPLVVQVLGVPLDDGECFDVENDCVAQDPCRFQFAGTLDASNCPEPVDVGWGYQGQTGSGTSSGFAPIVIQDDAACGAQASAWIRAGGITSAATGDCSDGCP
ncbi:MAG: hypothetical protein ACYSWX_05870 [Planctomycetota bacterium]|jgi:hypothetical protein